MKRIYRSSLLYLLFVIIAVSFTSCSRTTEDETNAWENNKNIVSSVKSKYPKFASAVDEQYALATTAWNNAQSMSDADAKLKAMGDANRLVSGSFITQLSNVNSSISDLDREASQYRSKSSADTEVANRVNVLITEIRSTQDYADNALLSGASTAAEAQMILDKVNSRINMTKSSLADLSKLVADKARIESDKNKTEQDKLAKIKADSLAKVQAVADWKCAYCGSANHYDVNKCGSCAAGRETKTVDTKNNWTCTYCSTPNANSSTKCGSCGASK
jgi:hypothetical protein